MSADSNKNIIVFTDSHTRYVEVFATKDQTKETVAKLLADQIIARHSAPKELLSDRGTAFMSDLVRSLCKAMNIKKIFTSSYHPATDGLVERFNQTLSNMISAFVSKNQRNWDEFLPQLAMAYNASIHESTNFSPYFLLFGREPITPIDVVLGQTPSENSKISDLIQKNKRSMDVSQN